MTDAEYSRFIKKVLVTDECWNWTASKNSRGYGQMSIGGRSGRPQLAHRLSYEHYVGPIPAGAELDHVCRNTLCVNPDHLDAVSHQENCRRGNQGKHLREKTHCKRGHEFVETNIYRDGNSRRCRQCALDRAARQRAQ